MMVKRLVTRCLVLRTLSSLSMNYHISSLHSFLHLCHCPRNGETEFQRCSEGARMSPLGYPWRRRMLYHIALSGVVFPSPPTSLPLLCLPLSYFRSVLRLLCQNELLRPLWGLTFGQKWSKAVFPSCPPICQSCVCSPKPAVRLYKFTHTRLMLQLLTSCSLVHMCAAATLCWLITQSWTVTFWDGRRPISVTEHSDLLQFKTQAGK